MGIVGGGSRELYYYDGVIVTNILTLNANEMFAVADLAVDSVGRAWVFISDKFNQNGELRIYNKLQGLVASYPLSLNSYHLYGCFYMNGKVYIGSGSSGAIPSVLIPISINNGVAQQGTPISFPNSDFYDLASCNYDYTIGVDEYANELNDLIIAPNPNEGVFNVTAKNEIKNISVYNTLGQQVYFAKNENKINTLTISLQEMPEGAYIVRVYDGVNYINKKIVVLK